MTNHSSKVVYKSTLSAFKSHANQYKRHK